MLSSLTKEVAKTTFEAIHAGALDYVAKTSSNSFGDELKLKVKEAARSRFGGSAPAVHTQKTDSSSNLALLLKGRKIGMVGIGASTGGPVALHELLTKIPASFPYPICVAIHMPKAFTGPFAERLNAQCPLAVKEAADGDILRPGNIYISPGGLHTTLLRQPSGITVKTRPTSEFPQNVYVPSVDLMASSLAEASGGSMLGVILTGMGNDGFKGMLMLKQRGGIVIAQDEATSTVFGMPKVCIDKGVADIVLPLGEIGPQIAKIT